MLNMHLLRAVAFSFCYVFVAQTACGQTPPAPDSGALRQGQGVQAAQDAREAAQLAQCLHRPAPPPPPPNPGPQANLPASASSQAPAQAKAIPGIIEAGKQWTVLYAVTGNNADGLLSTADGGILIAQNDNSTVTKLDRKGQATIVYRDTHTGGALSANKQGRLFIAEREFNPAIWALAPAKTLVANRFEGDPFDCIGGVLNDLSAASSGGVYFTMGGLFYADPKGLVTQYGTELRTNGVILSPDEKTLYVTNAGTLVAFDVQGDGSLANQRTFATLPGGGGDGSTVDSEGRVYVTANAGIVVIAPDGTVLGTIEGPPGLISVAFSGPNKQTLFAVAIQRNGKPGIAGIAGSHIISIPTLARGYQGRAK